MANVMNLAFPNTALPFAHRLALGEYPGYSGVAVNGYHAAAPTTGEAMWGLATTQPVFSATAIIAKISSADAKDTSDGVGARTVYVEGLSLAGKVLSETATLNGQTAVALANSYWRINRATVLTVGSEGDNAGVLYLGSGEVTTGVPAVINAVIAAGVNTTLSGFSTVPVGCTGLITSLRWDASAAGELHLFTRGVGELFTLQRRILMPAGSGQTLFTVPLAVAALGDIKLMAFSAASTIKAAASYDVVLCPV